jgi:hypothetical protein
MILWFTELYSNCYAADSEISHSETQLPTDSAENSLAIWLKQQQDESRTSGDSPKSDLNYLVYNRKYLQSKYNQAKLDFNDAIDSIYSSYDELNELTSTLVQSEQRYLEEKRRLSNSAENNQDNDEEQKSATFFANMNMLLLMEECMELRSSIETGRKKLKQIEGDIDSKALSWFFIWRQRSSVDKKIMRMIHST